jgi:hypothetical protein
MAQNLGTPDAIWSEMIHHTRQKTSWSGLLHVAADILDLKGWHHTDPLACFMLAGYVAAIAQPLIFGNLGRGIVALMTPVR